MPESFLGNLRQLPGWAAVAFAARCARRVQPLVSTWVGATARHRDEVEDAIRVAEALAAGSSFAGHSEADYTFSGRACVAAVYAGLAASEAARAAKGFLNPPSRDVQEAAELSVNAAVCAARNAVAGETILKAFKSDYELLLKQAASQSWTQRTFVGPEVFGPLWETGQEPDWSVNVPAEALRQGQPSQDRLEIRLRVPLGASSDQVKELVRSYMLAASMHHIAAGGSGLEPDTVEIYEGVVAPAEVLI